MPDNNLKLDFPSICEIAFEGDCIKVKSKIKDWKASLADAYKLDQITNELSRLAAKQPLWVWRECEDCLMAFSCEEEPAKGIFAELRDFKPKELEEKRQSTKEIPDERIDAELAGVQDAAIADIFKWKLNVPAYQRPYRWGQRNVESLCRDISAFKESNKESKVRYDFGMIVLLKKEGSYDIVDGQQRLVTLSLMLRSLGSNAAASFIQNTRLQGKASEENIACNLRWLRRQSARLAKDDAKAMVNTILAAKADVVVMDDLDDALKFFNRMNTAGVELTKIDILKSHHLLALASENALTNEAKERWQGRGFLSSDSCLDKPKEFKDEVVRQWESCDAGWLNTYLSWACALRMMACGEKPQSMDEIGDIEQFRGGNNRNGKTGLDAPMQDGEFFFWYAFNLHESFNKEIYDCKSYDAHAARLRDVLLHLNRQRALDFFDLLVVYMHEKKFPDRVNSEKFNRVIDLLFSWIASFYLFCDSVKFPSIIKEAMEDGSLFNAILSSETLDDCFDCGLENPLDDVKYRWDEWKRNDPTITNGNNYLLRRELRRIWQDLYL